MCLTIKKGTKPKRASHDIICWKYLEKKGNRLRAFYRETPYNLNEVYTEARFNKEVYLRWNEVNYGFHSFPNLEMARNECKTSPVNTGWAIALVVCAIPKGSMYFEGTYRGQPNYCSNKIKILALIK